MSVYSNFQSGNFLDDTETDNLMNDEPATGFESKDPKAAAAASSRKGNYSMLQMAFYQQYFDVSTKEVRNRILGSMFPRLDKASEFYESIRANPDLYGPFWISTTLIFTIAIGGNMYNFLSNFGGPFSWHTDFHKLTSAAIVIFMYWLVIPAVIYMLIRMRSSGATQVTFVEVLCIYGYSLAIYVPISVIWLVHIQWLQWLLVGMAVALSGSVLVMTLSTAFGEEANKKLTATIMVAVILMHALLGVGFKLYFFNGMYQAHRDTTAKAASDLSPLVPALVPDDLVANITTVANATVKAVVKAVAQAVAAGAKAAKNRHSN